MRRRRVVGSGGAVLLVALVVAAGPAAAGSPPAKKAPPRAPVKLDPHDQPEEAARFFLLKRSPDGKSPIDAVRYLDALAKMQLMPQYATALGAALPSRAELARTGRRELAVLGTWSWLGPGNVGGRTRGLVIHPTSPATMYAGGVAGGVWKTTNGGSTWAPLDDFLPNLAVTTLAMDPANSSVLYAGTGESWGNVDAVRGAGILKTTDAGATWSRLASTNTSDFYYVNKILVSPVTGRVYAATSTGIFRSADGGNSWTKVYATSLQAGVTDLAIRSDQPTDVVFAADGRSGPATLYRNTDAAGSGTWSPVYTETNLGRTSFAIAPSNQNVVYALASSIESGNFHNGLLAVLRSTDGGSNWTAQVRNTDPTKLNTLLLTNPVAASYVDCKFASSNTIISQGWYDNVIAVDPADPNRVWVGGIDLFRSDDGGATWGLASYWWLDPPAPAYAHADQHAIVFHPQYDGSSNRTMYVGNDGGLFRTDNARAATSTDVCAKATGAVVWTNLNNNYGVTQFYQGAVYPGGATYFGGAQDNGTQRGSDANGPNAWAAIIGGDGGYVAVDPTNTNVLYGETTELSFKKSTDGGKNFASAVNGITEASAQFGFITPFAMDPSNAQRLWIGGRMPWRTTDGAANWAQAGTAFTTGNFPTTAIAVAPTDANTVLFGRSSGIISRTTAGLTADGSTVWAQVLPTPVQAYNSWLTFDPANKNVAYATYSAFGVPHVWKSTDAGATWTNIDGSGATGIPDIPVHCLVVDPGNSSRLYVGTDLGVFVSVDGGANWSVENSGFANVVTESLVLSGNTLYAFTHGRGAYRVSLGSSGALSASFSYSPASPIAGQAVQFTDASTGGPTSWSWTFGDGGSATGQHVSHTFATAGSFPVTLTVSNGGASSSVSKNVSVGSGGASPCVEDATTMCLVSGRYRVTSRWKNQYAGGTVSTLSKARLTDVTGAFWIQDASTYEYLIRVSTATDNGHAWFAIPTFTDVEFFIDVTDTHTGQSNEYHSPAGNRTLIFDPFTFPFP